MPSIRQFIRELPFAHKLWTAGRRGKQLAKQTLKPLLLLPYAGDRFSCPICDRTWGKMLPFDCSFSIKGQLIDAHADNSFCPNCGSDMRHRFLFTFLREKINLAQAGLKLLHFAPEPYISNFLAKQDHVDYIKCDINPAAYPGAIKIDITDIEFSDNTFDGLICIHVLEHIVDDRRAIRELFRVLKPGGWALIAVPTYGDVTFEVPGLDYEERTRMYGIGDHVRLNGLDLATKLFDAGFTVQTYSIDDVPGNYVDRTTSSSHHVDSDKYLFYCRK